MQRILNYFFAVFMLSLAFTAIAPKKATAQQVSFQIFYDDLSPYGQWVNFPDEGYVWIPNAGPGFSPYQTNGYWAYTDYGWTWVSNYQWGWAPFHYGRWDFDDDYGWYWEPDYEWAPAWVAWSREPGYYGWAPLRPGVEVDFAITGGYYVPYEHWCYVHEEYLGRRDINRYYAPRRENDRHVRNSTMINRTNIDSRRTVYMGGPSRQEVEASTKAPIKPLTIVPRSTPGQSIAADQVSIYKPVVAKATTANPSPAPARAASIRDLKPLPGRAPNPERINAAPPAQQNQQRANPPAAATPPPAIRQNPPANSQVAPQNNRAAQPDARQQPPAQQNAPRENPRQQTTPRENPQQNTQRATPAQNAPGEIPPQQATPPPQRRQRYAPPKYNSPRPYNQPPQAPQHQAEPPRAAQPPQQNHAPPQQPQHNEPPQQPQHQAPPQQQHEPPQKENKPPK